MSARRAIAAKACTALLAVALLSMKSDGFGYAREVQSKPGWAVLELPRELLAHAQGDLADLRLLADSEEQPWLLEEQLPRALKRFELALVESTAEQTTGLIDRGEHPALSSSLSVELQGGEPFLKPIVIEASDDKVSFRQIAKSSIFRVGASSSMTVRFAPNDRRYLRLRLDDRNGAPVRPQYLVLESSGADARALAPLAAELKPKAAENLGVDTYTLELPSAHLPVRVLRFAVDSPAFSRRVSVYERLLFRDELSRRLVGEAVLFRSASGESSLTLALADVSSPTLEIEVQRAEGSLHISQAEYLVAPRRLVFFAPATAVGKLELLYGAPAVSAPHYDLAQALAHGQPPALTEATLGAERKLSNVAAAPLASAARAALDGAARWPSRAPIVLPAQGSIAYLDLEGEVAAAPYRLRIVDAKNQQVPFIVEAAQRTSERPAQWSAHSEANKTQVTLSPLGAHDALSGIKLEASAPEYFSREVSVYETTTDARGPVARRGLGSATWVHHPKESKASLYIAVARPSTKQLFVEVDDGDNVPLTISAVAVELARPRIDFAFQPGDELSLLWGNREASAPRYDFALLSSQVLASAASPARVKLTEQPPHDESPARPRWFWLVPVLGAALVLLVLARTLRPR